MLDGLRGIAILLVLMLHFYQGYHGALFYSVSPTLDNVLNRIVLSGKFGVELFFVLSGLLITGILLDSKQKQGFFFKFYMRRFLRIFPLYFAALMVVFLILPHFVNFDAAAREMERKQFWIWTYLANLPGLKFPWEESTVLSLGHFWSLCVEEHFYILWPTLVFLLSRRSLFIVCVVLVGIGILSRTAGSLNADNVSAIYQWSTLQRIDGLAIGAMLAIALRDQWLSACLPQGQKLKRWVLISFLLCVGLVFLPKKLHFSVFFIFGETIVVVFFGFVLLNALRSEPGGRQSRILSSKVLVAFGKYSYGIYVIHGMMILLFPRILNINSLPAGFRSPFVFQIVYYIFAIGISCILAVASYHLFEKRFLALKRHFEYE